MAFATRGPESARKKPSLRILLQTKWLLKPEQAVELRAAHGKFTKLTKAALPVLVMPLVAAEAPDQVVEKALNDREPAESDGSSVLSQSASGALRGAEFERGLRLGKARISPCQWSLQR